MIWTAPARLMATPPCGGGMRLLECARLSVKDVDFASNQIAVRGRKGDKARVALLPLAAKADPARHLDFVRTQQLHDLERGAGTTFKNRSCSAPPRKPSAGRGWPNRLPITRLVTPSRPICSKTGTLSGPFRNGSVIRT